jgi:GT2 family glycosyltransferase
MSENKDYEAAYREEKRKNTALACQLAEARAEEDRLREQLRKVKSSPSWKVTKPMRGVAYVTKKTAKRLKNLGGPRGFAIKVRQKLNDRSCRKGYGTRSFPDAEQRQLEASAQFPEDIKISILVPLYNTPLNFLKDMIGSVENQTCGHWELCLADGSDAQHPEVGEYCKERAAADPRIIYHKLERNEQISGNTNHCLELATGNYIGLLDHDDILHPSVIYEYMKAITEQGADYIYCDEGTFSGNSIDNFITLHFKPDFAPDNLRANNYICHFSVFKRSLLEGTEVFRSKFDGSQDHDMILRLTSLAKNVVHVPKLLYYWRSHRASVASDISAKPYAIEAARGAVADHLEKQGFRDFEIVSTRAFETIFRIKYALEGNPKVSILIPNCEHEEDLRRCVSSILEKSTYDNYEILIIENNSKSDSIFACYRELEQDPRVKVVKYEGAFHYSKVNNFGAQHATGEYLILLNNDTEVIALNWIEELLMFAQRKDVGAVGAKLYYPDRTIQHAGIVLGLGAHRTAGHIFYKFEGDNLGYMGKLWYQQDVSAVTGACLMVKKALYDELGGLDEAFAVALNDVDFCLRLREKGLLNIFNPYCELYHYESASRGSDVDGANAAKAERYNRECETFRKRWGEVLEKGDPYYNPNFTLDRADYSLGRR